METKNKNNDDNNKKIPILTLKALFTANILLDIAKLLPFHHQNPVFSSIHVTSRTVGKQVHNVLRSAVRFRSQGCASACKFAFFPVLTGNSLFRTFTGLTSQSLPTNKIVTNLRILCLSQSQIRSLIFAHPKFDQVRILSCYTVLVNGHVLRHRIFGPPAVNSQKRKQRGGMDRAPDVKSGGRGLKSRSDHLAGVDSR